MDMHAMRASECDPPDASRVSGFAAVHSTLLGKQEWMAEPTSRTHGLPQLHSFGRERANSATWAYISASRATEWCVSTCSLALLASRAASSPSASSDAVSSTSSSGDPAKKPLTP
mmetsp:Transcript_46862/g.116072  ORF Transcript_46862/g.116072 Transcript_46862/m.116072 type:complete len:115 (+) Transcript_46862:95-439(+)